MSPNELGLTFSITIAGSPTDANPNSRFWFGDWGVRVKSSPKAASIALSYLKSRLDIPNKEAQLFIVRDMATGTVQQNLHDTTADPGDCAMHWRISHTPTLFPTA